MQSIYMRLHCAEVCVHVYMVQVGSCWKCELCNWGYVHRDNLWSTLPWGILRGGGVLSVAVGQVVRIASRVSGLHPGGATLPSGRK